MNLLSDEQFFNGTFNYDINYTPYKNLLYLNVRCKEYRRQLKKEDFGHKNFLLSMHNIAQGTGKGPKN
jgi:hypothetical protein